MSQNTKNLFNDFKLVDPPTGLLWRIINRINQEKEILDARWRLVIFSVISILSLVILVLVFQNVRIGLAESGFSEFLSLVWSDSAAIFTYWQSFVLTLLETLPVISIMIFLIVCLIFLESLRFVLRDSNIIFRFPANINR